MKNEFSLEGKRALITGAGRGMGRSMALAMASHGADVVVAARTRSEVESVAAEINAMGRRGFALTIDLIAAVGDHKFRRQIDWLAFQAQPRVGGGQGSKMHRQFKFPLLPPTRHC